MARHSYRELLVDTSNLAAQLSQLLQDIGPPWLATLIKLAAIALPLVVGAWRWHYWVRERELKIRDARFKWLHGLLEQGKHIDCPGLLQELSFQQAYRYRYDETEIAFAQARVNPSQLLHDLRHGRPYARVSPDGTRIDEVPPSRVLRRLSLKTRALVVNSAAFLFGLTAMGSLIAMTVTPVGGLLLFIESACAVYMMFDISRGLDCAMRLTTLSPDRLRPKRGSNGADKLEVMKLHAAEASNEALSAEQGKAELERHLKE